MVVVGADVHKQTHTFVAVDEVGRQVGQLTVKATSEGHAKAWACPSSAVGGHSGGSERALMLVTGFRGSRNG